MIDFIKAKIEDANIDAFLKNPLLEFKALLSISTGEIFQKKFIANYKGLKFTIYEQPNHTDINGGLHKYSNIYIQGSIHKYSNNGKHNYNDFTFENVGEVLQDLYSKFEITPDHLKLQNVEIGVNITPQQSVYEIIENIFQHKRKPFKWCDVPNEGKYKQAEHSQYNLKVYDKSSQYKAKGFPVPDGILRIEIKYKKMEALNKIGIHTLSDLLKQPVEWYKEILLSKWDEILFYDFTIENKSKSLQNFSNPNYWKNLKKSNFCNQRKKLRNIVRTSSQQVQNEIKFLISKKVDGLYKNGVPIDQHAENRNIPKTVYQLTKNSNQIEKQNNVPIDTLNIQSDSTTDIRKCLVTGLDISMQKKGSKLLSHTGLKYYKEKDPELFNSLRLKYLSRNWYNSSTEVQIKELAHNIRTIKNYNRIRNERKYFGMGVLF